MTRKNVTPDELNLNVFKTFSKDWMLLTAGDFEEKQFNTMTIAWGSFGTMWNKPFAMVVVRPGRFTYEFMEEYNSFSLCAFPEEYKKSLNLCGTISGRDSDKIKMAQLTPQASLKITAPAFEEANLVLECKKMYYQNFDNKNFIDPSIEKLYPEKDYHRVYFGELVSVECSQEYLT